MKKILLILFVFFIYLNGQNIDNKENKTINIAFGFDKPPFVFGQNMLKGIEPDLVQESFALMGYKVNGIRMTKDHLETVLNNDNDIDGVSTISPNNPKLFYSDDFTEYQNYAITRKSDNLNIKNIDDLKSIKFVAWKNAYNDLGEEFYKLFNHKDGIYKNSYHENLLQSDDVNEFFLGKFDALIIDKTIFSWYKNIFKNKGEYIFHNIFPKKKIYPVSFKTKKIRDIFNKGLKKLKDSGRYQQIVDFYKTRNIVELKTYVDIVSMIASKYLYLNDYNKLNEILNKFFLHPDILSISVDNLEKNVLKISNKRIDKESYFEKDVFYGIDNDIIKVGRIKIIYNNNFEYNKGVLIPSLEIFNYLASTDLEFIKNIYNKYNISSLDNLGLTQEEKKYIQEHKILTVHNEALWAPYNFNENGTPKGFSVDYMNLIAQKLNINIKYISGYTWNQFLNLIKDEKIDIISNIVKTPQREKYINFTTPFISSKKAIFSNTKGFNTLSDLDNKTVAITEGFFIEEFLKQYYPKIKIKKYKNTSESIIAIIKNEADALIENYAVVNYLIKKNGLNIKYIAINEDEELISHISLGVRKSQLILRDILQKVEDSISKKEMKILENKWFGLENKLNPSTVYISNKKNIKYNKKYNIILSKNEKLYLENKKVVKMCVDPNWMPFEKIDKNGNYIGIISEYPKLFAKRLKIKFELVKTKNYGKSLQYLKQNRCDIIVADVITKDKNAIFLNTKPYLISPRAFVTHKDIPWVSNFSYLIKDKYKVGILKDSPAQNILKKLYKNINIVSFDSTEDGLKAVSSKNIIAFVSVMPSIAYSMQKNIFSDIKIAGYLKDNVKLSVLVNKKQAILVPILNKTIDSISQKEKLDIFDNWIKVVIDKKVDYKYLKVAIAIFIILLFIGFYINILLKKRVKQEIQKNREKEKLMLHQSRLAQMGEMISMIAHQWRQPLNNLSVLNQTVVLKYKRDKLDEKAIEYFKINSSKQIQSMSKTIDDFRNFFKPEKKKINFCINEIIENIINMIEPIFTIKEIEIRFKVDTSYHIIGYPNELGQAILNIINNAKDALIENNIKEKRIDILLNKDKDMLTLIIKDNAGGIPNNIKDKIFDPYFSTKNDKNGTGLGLYMTKMIIENHCDGKINVSNDEFGAVFKISLR